MRCGSLLLVLLLASGCGRRDAGLAPTPPPARSPIPSGDGETGAQGVPSVGATQEKAKPRAEGTAGEKQEHPVVEIQTSKGTVRLELYPEETPKTVANFLKLVDRKFYDGTRFHRYEPGFVIQGGDPNSRDNDPTNDGVGGPGWSIPLEIPPTLKHGRGALGMARSADPDSAGSQFYICLSDELNVKSLDGGYCVFGRVMEGMEVVDRLRAGDRLERARRIENVP